MMEIRVPEYYKKFKCTADQCPDTCCAGWQIVIDEKTLKKYHQFPGPFGNRLANSIDWREGVFKQYEENRCAFLDENNLCDIYTEAGEKMFCRTCRTYPRHYEEFENVREISLAMSCPEAAKLILMRTEPVRFLTAEKRCKEEVYENFDFFLYSKLTDARQIIFEILQDREQKIEERCAMVLAFAHDLQIRMDRGLIGEMETVFARYTKKGAKERFGRKLQPYRNRSHTTKVLKKEMLRQFSKLEVLRSSWPELLKRTRELPYDEERKKSWKEKEDGFVPEIVTEQLMVYFIFTYFCGAVYDEEAYTKMAFAVIGTLMIMETAETLWAESDSMTKMEAVLETAKCYSREVEHSDENIVLLEKLSKTEEVFSLENLIVMLLAET